MSYPSKAVATTELQRRGRPVRAGDVYQVACADLILIPYASDEMARAVALTQDLARALPGDGRKSEQQLAGEYMVAILAGRELGWDPMRSIRSFSVIKGRATLSADAMGGLVTSHPECEYLTYPHTGDESVTCEIKRRGAPEPLRVTFSLDDARKAGLYPGRGRTPWTTYTRDMLRKSATVRACRWAFPDAVGGFCDPDEIGAQQSFDGRPQRQTSQPPAPQRPPVIDVEPEPVAAPAPVPAADHAHEEEELMIEALSAEEGLAIMADEDDATWAEQRAVLEVQREAEATPIQPPAQESLIPAQAADTSAADWRAAFDAVVSRFEGLSRKIEVMTAGHVLLKDLVKEEEA